MNPSELKKIIQNRVDITQKQVAEKLGVTESTLINYLRKDSFDEIPLGSVKKISEATGIPLDKFIDIKILNKGLENTNNTYKDLNNNSIILSKWEYAGLMKIKEDNDFLKERIVFLERMVEK